MNEPCDICGGTNLESGIDVSLSGVYDAGVVRCRACGFRQIRPRLSVREIAELYTSDYFDPSAPAGFSDYARQQQRHDREARSLAPQLAANPGSGRLLEVGCALGFLLEALRRRSGWEVQGVDISPLAVRFARNEYGLDVRQGTLEEAHFPDERFDFIIAKDVMEHVNRPRDLLLETHRILAPRGRLLVVTPNGEANLRPLEALVGREPGQLPLLDQGHLSFFSLDHLRRLFSECGFECVRARTVGIRRGMRALGYLPRKARTLRTAGGGRPRPSGRDLPGGSGEEDETSLEEICARLRAEIAQRRSSIRTWTPYVWFRQAARALDSLPAWTGLGIDFEFLLRKGRG